MAAADVAYAPPMKSGKAGFEGAMEPQHRIRITLSSRNVKNLEKGMIARRPPFLGHDEGGPVAAASGEDFEQVAVAMRPHDQRLKDAARADGG